MYAGRRTDSDLRANVYHHGLGSYILPPFPWLTYKANGYTLIGLLVAPGNGSAPVVVSGRSMLMRLLVIGMALVGAVLAPLLPGSAPALAQLGAADLDGADIERFTGKRADFEALCGTSLREEKCNVRIEKGLLTVNSKDSIPMSAIREIVYSRGGDDPGPIGHRLWGKWYDQTGIFYVDSQGSRRLAVFGFRHAATWMHFNLNLVSARNGIWFQ